MCANCLYGDAGLVTITCKNEIYKNLTKICKGFVVNIGKNVRYDYVCDLYISLDEALEEERRLAEHKCGTCDRWNEFPMYRCLDGVFKGIFTQKKRKRVRNGVQNKVRQ